MEINVYIYFKQILIKRHKILSNKDHRFKKFIYPKILKQLHLDVSVGLFNFLEMY